MRTFFILLCQSYVSYSGAEINDLGNQSCSLLQMGHLARGAAPMGGGTSSPPDQGAACFAGGGGCADPPEHGSSHFGEAQIVQLGVKIVFPHPPLGIIMRN